MSLSNLKNEQLIQQAQALGINTTGLDRSQLIQGIKQHESNKVPETDAAQAATDTAAPLQAAEKTGDEPEGPSGSSAGDVTVHSQNTLPGTTDRCWFKVSAGQRADEKGPVFAAINGDSILIHRNSWVQLPMKFLPVFSDAITSEVVVLDSGKSVVRDMPRFNYEIRSLSEGKPKEQALPAGF